jgi:hypothetical protein
MIFRVSGCGERAAMVIPEFVLRILNLHLEESLLREYLLVELLDERVNRQFVAGRCRAAEGQISWIVPTERVTWQVSYLASHWGFHLRLLLFHFLAFKCIRLLCTLSLLFLSTVALSHSRFQFLLNLLNGGFGAGVRRNAFSFSAPSPMLCLRRSQRSPLIVSPSLYTQWRFYSKLFEGSHYASHHRSLLTASLTLRFHIRHNA